jgi:hypothetical protein
MSFSHSNNPSSNPVSLFGPSLSKANTDKINVIIPNGLLCDLNYQLSMIEFNKIAKTPINFKDPLLMPKILEADKALKAGGSVADFRQTLTGLLQLKDDVTADIFDKAWNAMLGDLQILNKNLQELKNLNKDKNLILLSMTSPIHVQAIHNAIDPEAKMSTQNPIDLAGIALYVSYLQKSTNAVDRSNDANLLAEIADDKNLYGKHTVVVLELSSDLTLKELHEVQDLNDKRALIKKKWAEQHGFIVVPFDRKTILNSLAASVTQQGSSIGCNPAKFITDVVNSALKTEQQASLTLSS